MHVGLYFGSFNPVHVGHLIIANFVADNVGLDQVWFIVSPQNPLKPAASLLNEYHRLYLVKLATENHPKLKVSDIEFKLPRPSYTIDTLIYLQEKYAQHQFSVIVGSDSYQNIDKWKNSDVLLKNYSFIVYERPNHKIDKISEGVKLLKAPMLDISSTLLRKTIESGKSIRYMVPDNVLEEIEKGGYYKK